MGLHIFQSGYSRLQTRMCVCGVGGCYLKAYESLTMFSNMMEWTGGRPLPSRPLSLSSHLGAAREKFPPPPSIFLHFFLPSSYSRPLFSLLSSRLLPLTLSAPSNIIWLQIGRRWGVQDGERGLYIDLLRCTPGRDKEVMHGRGIQDWRKTERKLIWKGGGGVDKNCARIRGSVGG